MRGLSIKWKISFIAAFASAVALVLAFGFLMVYDLAVFQKSVEQDIDSLAQVIGSNSVAALKSKDKDRASRALKGLRARKEVVAAALYGADGALIGRYVRGDVYSARVPAKPTVLGATMQSGSLETVQLVREDGQSRGYVFLASDTSAWAERLKRYGWTALTVLMASLVMASLVAWLLHRTISSPIYDLLHTIRRVSSMKNYSLRAEKPTDDEIGDVVDGFNQMLAEVEARDEAVRLANEELEDRVRARTEELEQQIAERERAQEEAGMRNQELLTLHRISQIDLSTQSLASAFEDIVGEIASATGFPMVTLEVYDRKRELMTMHAAHGLDPSRPMLAQVSSSESVSGSVARSGSPLVRLLDQNGMDYGGEALLGMGVRTFICMPMTGQEGVAGTLSLATYDPVEPDQRFLRWLESLANYLAFLLERQSGEERLRQSEERTRKVIETALDSVISMDADGKITGWNPQAEAVFGWSSEEVLGLGIRETIVPPSYRDMHEQGVKRYLESGESRIIGERIELTAMHRDGREFPIEISISPIASGSGFTFTAFIRDITARKKAESDLARARDAALDAARLKSEFLANMSHEIRTPMNGVIGMTDLLLDTEMSEEQQDYAVTIRNSASALLTVINDILDFSKIEAGRMVIDITDFDIREILEEVAELVSSVAQSKGVEMLCAINPDVPRRVRTDPVRLRQIANNLLGNAVKFTERGEIVLLCEMAGSEEAGQRLRISVRDTGIGIPAESLKSIFESFTQVDGSTTRRFGGTGLGLTISRQLTQLMNGELGVESRVGVGSTFWVEIPVEVVESASTNGALPEIGKIRALVVDDNATNRTILEQQLRSWGCVPECADGGEAALELLRRLPSGKFDLAILDMQMPGMDGSELSAIIKREFGQSAPKIILLSSTGQQWSEFEMAQAGFSACLTKPARQSQIFDTIVDILGVQRSASKRTAHTSDIFKNDVSFRILLAEDNAVNRKVATKLLGRLGHVVTCALNGLEAIKLAMSEEFDLVLMDVQMPEMDGLEATATIRQFEADTGKHLPIIAMTAHVMKGDRERCLFAGMDDYVSKPITPDKVRRILQRWEGKPKQTAPDDIPKSTPVHLVDWQYLDEISGGDSDFKKDLVEEFMNAAPAHLDSVRVSLESGDERAAASAAHALKGCSASLGASSLAEACSNLEASMRTSDWEKSLETVEQVYLETVKSVQTEVLGEAA